MRVHVLQHVPFEGLGSIEAWLCRSRQTVSWTRFHAAGWQLPHPDAVDLVIVLGGPMSVHDEGRLRWLQAEKAFVDRVMQRQRAVLGICLGAQLIASVLGARVYPGRDKEIGWFPVSAEHRASDAFSFPATFEAFHWHGETFDLPAGATHLASSAACRHQAFRVGRRIMGLQFHLETTPESVAALIAHCGDELVPGPFIQREDQLVGAPPSLYQGMHRLMVEVLASLTEDLE